jgi:hypothetical protein
LEEANVIPDGVFEVVQGTWVRLGAEVGESERVEETDFWMTDEDIGFVDLVVVRKGVEIV